MTPRVRYLVNESVIKRNWQQLASKRISADRFLTICETLLEAPLALMLYRREPPVNDFQPYAAQELAELPVDIELDGAEIAGEYMRFL